MFGLLLVQSVWCENDNDEDDAAATETRRFRKACKAFLSVFNFGEHTK